MEPCSHMDSSFQPSFRLFSHMVSSCYTSCYMESCIHQHPSQHPLQASPNAIVNRNPTSHLHRSAHMDPSPC